jgi:PEP-CTERM motif
MIRRASSWLCALLPVAALVLGAGAASATVIEATASSFTGDRLSVSLKVDDAAVPGDLVITLKVEGPGSTLADLRGFFVHVANESLLSGLTVTGPDVTSSSFLANAVAGVGPGNNLNGGGSPCPCDIGVELGTQGIARNDLQTVTFTLSHATASLDISFLASQEFGVRATSVGKGKCRDGSSKLAGVLPVPEPGTAILMGLGLAGLAGTRSRSR